MRKQTLRFFCLFLLLSGCGETPESSARDSVEPFPDTWISPDADVDGPVGVFPPSDAGVDGAPPPDASPPDIGVDGSPPPDVGVDVSPPPDASPDKKIQPDSSVVKTFKTIDGETVLSAENYSSTGGTIGSWYLDKNIKSHLGSGYMRSSKDNNTLKFDPDLAALNFIINFKQTGRYYVHLRTYAKDITENGFFATLDGKEVAYGGSKAFYVYVKPKNSWSWYTDGGGAGMRNLKVSFNIPTPGKHVFSLHRRDTGSRVDHIWLTKKQSAPQNVATLPIPDAKTFHSK